MAKKLRAERRVDRSDFTDDELYNISSRLLCGEAPSRIASGLGLSQTVIKRAIPVARARGILQLNFFPDRELERVLGQRRAGTAFTVVPDEFDSFTDGEYAGPDPVAREGATVVRRQIEELLRESTGPVYVGIGGGFTVRKTVDFMDADIHHDPPAGIERLTFLSLNAATPPNLYDRSANFLAVRCAQIYSTSMKSAGHLALVPGYSERHDELYRSAIANLSLVVASGGGRHSSFLSYWLIEQGLPIEDHVAGDVAYVPIDHRGQRAACCEAVEKAIERLHPALSYNDLVRLSAGKKVTLILSENRGLVPRQYALDAAREGNGVVPKLEIARALMEVPLASTVVIGRSLARLLIDPAGRTAARPRTADRLRTRRRPRTAAATEVSV